jgi:hypothetical protein
MTSIGCCLLALVAFGMPRIVLAFMYFNDYLNTAYKTCLWPLLGFFFMPYTTIAWAYAVNALDGGVKSDTGILILIIAAVLDIVGLTSTSKKE